MGHHNGVLDDLCGYKVRVVFKDKCECIGTLGFNNNKYFCEDYLFIRSDGLAFTYAGQLRFPKSNVLYAEPVYYNNRNVLQNIRTALDQLLNQRVVVTLDNGVQCRGRLKYLKSMYRYYISSPYDYIAAVNQPAIHYKGCSRFYFWPCSVDYVTADK